MAIPTKPHKAPDFASTFAFGAVVFVVCGLSVFFMSSAMTDTEIISVTPPTTAAVESAMLAEFGDDITIGEARSLLEGQTVTIVVAGAEKSVSLSGTRNGTPEFEVLAAK